MRTSLIRFTTVIIVMLAGAALQAQPAYLHGDPTLATRKNLGGAINSGRSEISPVLSPDGKTLYFDRKFDARNTNGTDDPDEIYVATLERDGTWSRSVNVGPPLNSPGSDVLFWISPDGNTALVHNGAVVDGRTVGLAITHKDARGAWGMPASITIEGIANLNEIGEGFSAFIAPDGVHLILGMVRDTANSSNVDLYICRALGSDYMHWGAPMRMSDTINTQFYEWAPFMADDNITLYFASGGLFGYGASDIYMTRRLDDSWQRWSEPVNLGETINTQDFEAALVVMPDGKHALMSAINSGMETGYGKTDIYEVVLPDSMRPLPVVVIQGTLKAGTKAVKGLARLVNAVTGIEAASVATDDMGSFTFRPLAGQRYRMTGWADGYNERAVTIDARKPASRTMKITVPLERASADAPGSPGTNGVPPSRRKPLSGGGLTNEPAVAWKTLVEVDGFAAGSAAIPAAAIERMRKAVVDLKTLHAGTVFGVRTVGYAATTGGRPEDPALAQQRAEAVRTWLLANGLAEYTIIASARDQGADDAGTSGSANVDPRRVVVNIIVAR